MPEDLIINEGGSKDFLPWYNYPVINFLKSKLSADLNIFEFGSGYSTLFYARRVFFVTAVETRLSWQQLITSYGLEEKYSNLKINHLKNEDFSSYLLNNQSTFYDCICIDSIKRIECLKNSLNSLKPAGIILFDNCERINYKTIFEFMLEKGFKCLIFSGNGPNRAAPSSTAIFYRKNNVFNLT